MDDDLAHQSGNSYLVVTLREKPVKMSRSSSYWNSVRPKPQRDHLHEIKVAVPAKSPCIPCLLRKCSKILVECEHSQFRQKRGDA